MTPFYEDPSCRLYQGDSLDVLREMEAGSVHMVCTSPPYWGLRKYDGPQERVWSVRADSAGAEGGVEDHEHEWAVQSRTISNNNGDQGSTLEGRGASSRLVPDGAILTGLCLSCGAWRGSYGLEPLHDCLGWAKGERCNVCYVCHSLAFLDAIWRVLRDDGVCFLNLGDSYSGSNRGVNADGSIAASKKQATNVVPTFVGISKAGTPPGLKPKDLCLIPQRIALAAQASGWYVRSLIVWAKPNPMPESVRDRPTSAYEHIIRLEKSRPNLSAVEASWLAGSFDSDGCIRIGIYRHKDSNVGYAAQVIFDGRSERLVRRVADVAGVGSVTFNKGRQCWSWRCSSNDAAWILAQVEVFLVDKREQAALALKLHSINGRVGNGATPPELTIERHKLFELCKRLNGHKGAQHGYEPAELEEAQTYSNVLMLTKSERYYWDQEAVREPTGEWHEPGEHSRAFFDRDPAHLANGGKQNRRSKMPDGWDTGLGGHGSYHREGREDGAPSEIRTGRNMRDVWTIPTQPYPEAHFATFPEAIPDRCIRAATSEHGVCGACGAPWERVTENKPMVIRRTDRGEKAGNRTATSVPLVAPAESITVGWRPTCGHEAPVIPATVLDPFAGSGTTLAVAKRLGRYGVGIELSAAYCQLVRTRVEAETARML